ncbi:alpha/beta fold hydrolase [Microvirga pudoricolor]|uniref:alpha/beta fold hydrolase n=1 Tax=Microvirga pudoricolor TaxID=2778729 RepID=UPI0019528752|nr:alpha/beta hydrolase [Microvirga pudoricolor]MBM6595053.1 alpha/beta hydrolase [Microvirga pudoricolor]
MGDEQQQFIPGKTSQTRAGAGSGMHQWLPRTVVGVTALGAAALYNRRQTINAEHQHPPIGQFLKVGQTRLHYLEQGEGNPVILIHGNGSMIQDFTASGLVDDLASRYRVIVFDRPGFGHSTRPGRLWTARDYARLFQGALKQLGIKQAVVLGHSWGSLVAIALALEAPSLVRGLVLASGYYYPTPRLDVLMFSPPAIPIVGDVFRHTAAPLISRAILPKLVRKVFVPNPVPERFQTEFPITLALRPSQLRASAEDTAMMIPSAMDLSRHYQNLRLPVTIMTGTDDRIVDCESQSWRLHKDVPHSTFIALDGIGHMIHHFAPQMISEVVDQLQEKSQTGPRSL